MSGRDLQKLAPARGVLAGGFQVGSASRFESFGGGRGAVRLRDLLSAGAGVALEVGLRLLPGIVGLPIRVAAGLADECGGTVNQQRRAAGTFIASPWPVAF